MLPISHYLTYTFKVGRMYFNFELGSERVNEKSHGVKSQCVRSLMATIIRV